MTTSTTLTARTRRRWAWPVAVLAVTGLASGLLQFGPDSATARRLADAEAEADRLDPGWRLEDLEARRAPVPDEENAARVVVQARRLMPRPWPTRRTEVPREGPELAERLTALRPNELPDPDDLAMLRGELANARTALGEALRLAALPRGRYDLEWRANVTDSVTSAQDAQDVGDLLRLEALRRAIDGDADGAAAAALGVLNAARSVGDEPRPSSQLLRAMLALQAADALERVLAHAEPGSEVLATLQRAFEEEAAEPVMLNALRAERAYWHRFLSEVRAGRASRRPGRVGPEAWHERREAGWAQPELLEIHSLLVEAAKRPPAEWPAAWAEADARAGRGCEVTQVVAGGVAKGDRGGKRWLAVLRAAAVAAAAERYRIANGAWPESPEAMVGAGLLRAVPDDPFDGKPLRWARRADGVSAYSVGPDGSDDGGTPGLINWCDPGMDLVIRLYDPCERGRR